MDSGGYWAPEEVAPDGASLSTGFVRLLSQLPPISCLFHDLGISDHSLYLASRVLVFINPDKKRSVGIIIPDVEKVGRIGEIKDLFGDAPLNSCLPLGVIAHWSSSVLRPYSKTVAPQGIYSSPGCYNIYNHRRCPYIA